MTAKLKNWILKQNTKDLLMGLMAVRGDCPELITDLRLKDYLSLPINIRLKNYKLSGVNKISYIKSNIRTCTPRCGALKG